MRPVVDDDDLVRDLEGLFLVVRDEHRRHLHLVVQAAQPVAQLLADLGVQRAERLVEQQHLGLDRERARQRHALPLSAGQLRRQPVGELLQVHQLEQLVTRRRISSLGRLRISRPKATLRYTDRWRERRVVLEDEADVAVPRRHGGRVLAVDVTVPVSALSSPAMMRSSVDLPPPLGPSSAVSAPAAPTRSMSSSATKSPKRLAMPWTSMPMSGLPRRHQARSRWRRWRSPSARRRPRSRRVLVGLV